MSSNVIQGNYIGTDASGAVALPNQNYGVVLSASNITVAGRPPGRGTSSPTTTARASSSCAGASGDAILGNSIFGNTGLGIDLGDDGVTANNAAPNPARPNFGHGLPRLHVGQRHGDDADGGRVRRVGGGAGRASPTRGWKSSKSDNDPGGYGQGQTYLGFLTTDASGNFSGTLAVGGLTAGDTITGTAHRLRRTTPPSSARTRA